MLLHRWVARIFVLQVVLHSLIELVLYMDKGVYAEELVKEYWIWGIVATVFACAMLVGSALFIRRWSYEAFLIGHVLMAVFVIVGCWYHVELPFERIFSRGEPRRGKVGCRDEQFIQGRGW